MKVDVEKLRAQLLEGKVDTIDGDDDWYIPFEHIKAVLRKDVLTDLSDGRHLDDCEDTESTRLRRRKLVADIVAPESERNLTKVAVSLYIGRLPLTTRLVTFAQPIPIDGRALEADDLRLNGDDRRKIVKEQDHFVEVVLPLNSLVPKLIPEKTILSFRKVRDGVKDEGALGVIEQFTMQGMPHRELVRKQFEPTTSEPKAYLGELRSLCLLSEAAHPNMVHLLAAYSHRGKYNFIMPLANHGSLEKELHTDAQPSHLASLSDAQFVYRLAGLASALSCMHNLKSDELDMIGVHRDLKPANILLTDNAFILADFGLSKVTSAQNVSGSDPPDRNLDYVAPECLNPHNETQTRGRRVGRKGDIWSLGCMILMMLLFRFQSGYVAIRDFEELRKAKYGGVRYRLFWSQEAEGITERLSESVRDRLDSLKMQPQTNASPSIDVNDDGNRPSNVAANLAVLVEDLLVVKSARRPTALQVSARLQFLTLSLLAQKVKSEFKTASERSTTHVMVEQWRFEGWCEVAGLPHDHHSTTAQTAHIERPWADFEVVACKLFSLLEILTQTNRKYHRGDSNQIQEQRFNVDLLISTLSTLDAQLVRQYAQARVLGHEATWQLRDFQAYAQQMGDDQLQRMTSARLDISREADRDFQYASRRAVHEIDNFLDSPHERLQIIALPHQAGRALAEEGRPRPDLSLEEQESHIGRVISLLDAVNDRMQIKALSCHHPGFYLETKDNRCGLLYKLPANANGVCTNFIPLAKMLGSTHKLLRLPLGKRFKLAFQLARSLSVLHGLGWRHRRISAQNVVFFYSDVAALEVVDVADFYYVGFVGVRHENSKMLTDGNVTGDARQYYQHPNYRKGAPFEYRFDYYAFGVLLLEIGLWKPLIGAYGHSEWDKIADTGMDGSHPAMKDLPVAAGKRFYDAVSACLYRTRVGKDGAWLRGDVEAGFVREVLGSLGRCDEADLDGVDA